MGVHSVPNPGHDHDVKRPFHAEMDVSRPQFFVFHAVSHLGDIILQSHPVHCSKRCWTVRHSTCLRGAQTLQQVVAQRVRQVALCPGVTHQASFPECTAACSLLDTSAFAQGPGKLHVVHLCVCPWPVSPI